MAASNIMGTKFARALTVGLASAILGIVLIVTGALDAPERTMWDWRVRMLAAPTDATSDIVLVLVDQESLELMSSQNGVDWPWPRSFYGYMIDYLAYAGAASVTFDVILEDQGKAGVADDQYLRSEAGAYGRTVYGAELLGGANEKPEAWPAGVSRPEITVTGIPDAEREAYTFSAASFPHPDTVPPNATIAFVNQDNDDDGVFRRYRLLSYQLDRPVPALGVAPAIVAAGGPVALRFEHGKLYFGDEAIPVDREGRLLLRYTTPPGVDADGNPTRALHASVPAFDVVIAGYTIASGSTPDLDPTRFAGKHVFVGLSASGLLDLRPTPLDPRAPGVSVHATMLDNLISGDFLRDFPLGGTIVLLILLTIGSALAATYAQRTITEVILIVAFLAAAVGIGIGGYVVGFWVPIVVPLVAVFVAIAAANVANYATEGAQKRFINGAFSTYLSPTVVAQLVANPELLQLRGEKRELTMFFSDIQGFTTLSEGLEPEQLSGFLTSYLTELVDIIQAEGGTIDKFEGDAIIAFWNAPVEIPDHPVNAVRAALLCQQKLDELRPEYRKPIQAVVPEGAIPAVGRDIFTRIGLNTSEVSVGNFGSRKRFDYTALGDGMNLASRLEGANKIFGSFIMVSHATRERLGDEFRVRELGRIRVVGRQEPVTVYEPMFVPAYDSRAGVYQAYDRGLRFWYNNRLDEARAEFASVAADDRPAARMVEQCDEWLGRPPEMRVGWTGVVSLTEK